MPHTPVRSRRLRSVLTGGAVPLLLLTGLPAQAHAQEAAVHTVRPGDSLTRISAARGVSVADLLRFNGLGLETVLYPGDELRLTGAAAPAAGTYTVQPNDGWWVIARRTGVSAAQLQRLNGMSASSMLHPGMVLTTPVYRTVPPPRRHRRPRRRPAGRSGTPWSPATPSGGSPSGSRSPSPVCASSTA
ncbi:LysM peptidoglycan-binding domain-containing protein [Micrococcus sp. KRD026]|uniref:LysM peptidoglycan-binding domain-containing protein n=1 Tax=Micrococcus sp. KRD026 TaxID=2729718 RepID=UPI003144F7BE